MANSNQTGFPWLDSSHPLTYKNSPKVRLKMVGRQEYLDFEMTGKFNISDEQGTQLAESFSSNFRWRAQVDAFTPPTFQYILFVVEALTEAEAEEIIANLVEKGYEAWHRRLGYKIEFESKGEVFENYRYRVFIGPLPNKQAARGIQTKLLGIHRSQIFKVPFRQARGFLEITDLQIANTHKGAGFIRIEPAETGTAIVVHGILNDGKYEPYTFRHGIEFHIADDGRLFLVGELDVDEYVTGVVTAIFDPDYPEEFLKAAVVAYQSAVLSNLGMIHYNEPYDYCRKEHCFEFEWRDSVHHKIKKVMKSVRGKFLIKKGLICDARQHPICGGHTEHINVVMNRNIVHDVSGRYDMEKKAQKDVPKNLRNEANAEKWIAARPAVLCNFRENGVDKEYERYVQGFRWVVEYSRHDLDEIIRKKTEEDIGVIYDIVPVHRGGSGRLMELEILGSHRNVLVMGEQDIRTTLSETVLPSSFFMIEIEWGVDGSPSHIVLSGAGRGHGVGMCQAGGVALAHRGYEFLQILTHYFGQVELESVFPNLKQLAD